MPPLTILVARPYPSVTADDPVKIVQVKLENRSGRIRRINATYFAEWVLGTTRESTLPFIIPEFASGHFALLARNPYNQDFQDADAFLASSRERNGITYDRLWDAGHVRLNCGDDWRPFANGGFNTPSGKAELYSESLRQAGHDPLPSAGEIHSNGGLQLITGKQLHFLNSGYNNQDRHSRRAGELFVEIHTDDARQRGVAHGESVRVRNDRGEVRAVCRVSDRVRPGVVWMPFGGFTDANGERHSVNALTAEEPTDWGGGSGLYDAFVDVSPQHSTERT